MTYFVVLIREYKGWECDGHTVPYVVAAHDEVEARGMFPPYIDDYYDHIVGVRPFVIPDLTRKKKPFIAL